MEQFSILNRKDLLEIIESQIQIALKEVINESNSDNQNPLLTREEAAKMLDISLPTLLQWEKDDVIPKPKRLGKRVYFIRKNFIAFLESTNNQK